MRGRIYLLTLLLVLGAAAYFAANGDPVRAVLAVFPGYLVVAYILVLISTFLPGAEKKRYEEARAAAFPTEHPAHPDTPLHPAFMGSVMSSAYSGDGFLGWPEQEQLTFRALIAPAFFHYPPHAFRGFKIESTTPPFLGEDSLINPSRGPVVMLDGNSAAAMVRLWVQPDDVTSFADRLRSEGIPELD